MAKKTLMGLLLIFCSISYSQLLKINDHFINFKINQISQSISDTLQAQYYSCSYSNDTLIDLYGNDATFSGDTITFSSGLSIFDKSNTDVWHTDLLKVYHNNFQWLWSEIQNEYTLPRMKGIDNCFRLFVSGTSIQNSKILLFETSKEDEYHTWTNFIGCDYPFIYYRVNTTYSPTELDELRFWNDTSKLYVFWDDGDIDTVKNAQSRAEHIYSDGQPYIKIVGDLEMLKRFEITIRHMNDANIELYENTFRCEYYYMYRNGHHGNIQYMSNNDSLINWYFDNTINYEGERIYGDITNISRRPKLEDIVTTDTYVSDTVEFADISNIKWIHFISNPYLLFDLDSIQYLTTIISDNIPVFYFVITESASYGDVSNYQYFDSTGFSTGNADIVLEDMDNIYGDIGVFSKFKGVKKFLTAGSNALIGNMDTLIGESYQNQVNWIGLGTGITFDIGDIAQLDSVKYFNVQNNKNGSYTSPGGWGWNNIYISLENCSLSSEIIDQLIIDLDSGEAVNGSLYILKNSARTGTSSTSYNNLISKGWTINE